MCFIYVVFIHELQKVLGELTYGKWGIATWSLPVSACVDCDNSEMLRQRLHLMLKVTAILTVSVEQNQRETFSFFNIVVLYIHDRSKGTLI